MQVVASTILEDKAVTLSRRTCYDVLHKHAMVRVEAKRLGKELEDAKSQLDQMVEKEKLLVKQIDDSSRLLQQAEELYSKKVSHAEEVHRLSVVNLANDVGVKDEELKKREANLKRLSEAVVVLKRKIASLEGDKVGLQLEVKSLKEALKDQEKIVHETNEMVDKLQAEVLEYAEKLATAEAALTQQKEDAVTQQEEMNSQIESLREKVKSLREVVTGYEQEISALKAEANLKDQVSMAKLTEKELLMIRKDERIQELQAEITALVAKVRVAEEARAKLEEELEAKATAEPSLPEVASFDGEEIRCVSIMNGDDSFDDDECVSLEAISVDMSTSMDVSSDTLSPPRSKMVNAGSSTTGKRLAWRLVSTLMVGSWLIIVSCVIRQSMVVNRVSVDDEKAAVQTKPTPTLAPALVPSLVPILAPSMMPDRVVETFEAPQNPRQGISNRATGPMGTRRNSHPSYSSEKKVETEDKVEVDKIAPSSITKDTTLIVEPSKKKLRLGAELAGLIIKGFSNGPDLNVEEFLALPPLLSA